jgi:hypothetical protein
MTNTIWDERTPRLEVCPKRFLFSGINESDLIKSFLESKANQKVEEQQAWNQIVGKVVEIQESKRVTQ